MKLSDSIDRAITKRFREHSPRSFNAKIRLIMSCDAISPYPTYREARSLLSQRGAKSRKRKEKPAPRPTQDFNERPMRLPYVDN